MNSKCQMVVFSNKAYNAIIRESFDKDPVETGGILLGHILDNGVWIVMEVLPPGINCIFQRAYFEYDDAFVNYLAQSVANQYKIPLELLGLWHRHPGSMDVFSSTDDGTNKTFALQNPSGVISGLVNIDPKFRLTMYHMDNPINTVRLNTRPNYKCVNIEVGDDIIPEEYFHLRYYDGEASDLNPFVEGSHTYNPRSVRTENNTSVNTPSLINDYKEIWKIINRNRFKNFIVVALIIISLFSFKQAVDNGKKATKAIKSWVIDCKQDIMTIIEDIGVFSKDSVINQNINSLKIDTIQNIDLDSLKTSKETNNSDVKLKIKTWNNSGKGSISLFETYSVITDKYGDYDKTLIQYISSDSTIATITNKGNVTPHNSGTTNIKVLYNNIMQDSLLLTITEK